MAKSLVIVESPAKAKTINKFLGPDYIVKPTGGHVIDLPPDEIGIDIENGFIPHYSVIKGKGKILSDLKKSAQNADTIYLATDPDREGEAIAWHVANRIIGKNQPFFRILFNQITKDAVVHAIDNKSQLDLKKVNAQQARRVLDRIVGYKVSPFLWKTMYSGLSAGRVQSVALRLIVERDTEIEAFIPEEYWIIKVLLATENDEEFEVKLIKKNNTTITIKNAEEAEAIVQELSSLPFHVKDITQKKTKKKPFPPFITSTLQQDAYRRLGYTVSRTMGIAQSLYEGVELEEGSVGIITYMRTDSTRVASEAIQEARNYIEKRWGQDQLPSRPNIYKAKKSAQDAHEAIRPTSVMHTPERVKNYLSKEQLRLYTIIWSRFIASQMKPAEYTMVTAHISAGEYELRAGASHIDFKGYLAVYEDLKKDKDKDEDEEIFTTILPKTLVEGDPLSQKDITPSQKFTKPLPRYTEASLVREMESKGIGRPSTYAQIIITIISRDYVKREKGKLVSTELGRNVNKILMKGFPDLFNVTFTANMEEELDKIESGEYEWLHVVNSFYGPFNKTLETMNNQHKELKQSLIEQTDEMCEECGKPMVIRWGRNGKFMACSGFPKCRNTKPIEKNTVQTTDEVCDKCGSPMEVKRGKYGRFLACSNYPKCKNIKPLTIGVKCPLEGCEGVLTEKTTKKGRLFYGCNRYPDCKYASWDKPVNIKCEKCGSPTLIESKNGEYLTCPRCKTKFDRESIEA